MKYYVLYNVIFYKFVVKILVLVVFGFFVEINEGIEFCFLVISCCRVKIDFFIGRYRYYKVFG